MSDDEPLDHRLLQQAEAYGRLYPSILPRLKAALASGNPALQALVQSMQTALSQAEDQRERQLRDGWGLSAKEAHVALRLIEGATVSDCAADMGIAESTVRTHVKSVFAKTGRTRQSQLGSLLQLRPGLPGPDA
ncbi:MULTISPECIES: helix-turn-helix transcriptional regulator [unclassified Phenylobacterium]|uniref:helix-turn-helix transcriptional regulator n=1 Tax=unclassified Phenylobacterium TaxID=2640670 RepID=UPI00083A42C2|nr:MULTISPECIES: LuxR C-terminal-related transcriptional regulator [unclassified Phenylobacterium]